MTGIFPQICARFTKFGKKGREDPAAEVYLEPFQTYMIELFCENSSRLRNKCSIIDNWNGSKHTLQLQI